MLCLVNNYKIATKRKRIYAYLIDAFIQTILFLPLTFLIVNILDNKYSWENINFIICFFTYTLNRIIYASFHNGSSIGKVVVGLKIISISDKKVTFFTILIRELVFSILKYIDVLWILFGKYNQTAHDRLLDLVVVDDLERDE